MFDFVTRFSVFLVLVDFSKGVTFPATRLFFISSKGLFVKNNSSTSLSHGYNVTDEK